MTDGITKGTGTSWKLKSAANLLTTYPTYEKFVQALVNGTLTVDLNLNTAGWSTQGTPLNKANLLTDATAALYGKTAAATPNDIFAAIPTLAKSSGEWRLLADYKTAGTFTWTAPNLFNGAAYEIGVLIIGAGGSGGVHIGPSGSAYPGLSGFAWYSVLTVSPGASYPIVVGAGGSAVSMSHTVTTSNPNADIAGNNGGSSAFNGVTALGGNGGGSSMRGSQANGFFGGKLSNQQYLSTFCEANDPLSCFNPFECRRILGSGALYQTGVWNAYSAPDKDPFTGKGGGDSYFGNKSGSFSAKAADDSGCGGGMVYISANVNTGAVTATSGKGGDGAVKIYVRGKAT